VFLGDPNVEVPIGMHRLEKTETCATWHRPGDSHNLSIGVRKFA
jgi:hypothetical protein